MFSSGSCTYWVQYDKQFFRNGKHVVYTKLVDGSKTEAPSSLTLFGFHDDVSSKILAARIDVLALYGKKAKACSTLTKLRYTLAATTVKSTSELPPTEDAFKQHVLRPRYQVAVC